MKNAFEPPRNIYKLEQSKQQQSTEKASHCILVIQRREYGKRMLRQKIERPGTTESYEQK
jgi:hypothetical protein